MIGYIYILFTFVIVMYYTIKKPEYIIFLFIIFYNFGDFVLAKTDQTLFSFYHFYIQLLVFTSILLHGLLKEKLRKIFFNKITFLIAFSFVFLALLALYNGTSPIEYFVDYRRNLSNLIIIPFVFTLCLDKNFLRRFISFLTIILIINVAIAFIQNFGGAFFYDFFSPKVFFSRNGAEIGYTNKIGEMSHLVSGPFLRMNNFGNFIVLVSIIIAASHRYLNLRIITPTVVFIITFLAGLAIVFTGNRISVLSFIVGLLLIYFLNNWKKLLLGLSSLLIVIVFSGEIMQLLNGVVNLFNLDGTPIGRIALILNSNMDVLIYYSTFYLSYTLFPDLLNNFLLGAGKLFQGGYKLVAFQSKNTTDATLVLYITELGIIGFFVVISPILYSLRKLFYSKSKNQFAVISIVFAVLIVQMLTDAGLFYKVNNFIYFSLIGVLINPNYYFNSNNTITNIVK